jgi:hypothetical protein
MQDFKTRKNSRSHGADRRGFDVRPETWHPGMPAVQDEGHILRVRRPDLESTVRQCNVTGQGTANRPISSSR